MKHLQWLFALFLMAGFGTTAGALPAIQEARLDNGLRVLLIEAHNVPMVSMQLSLPAGSRFDPPGKGGAASLLASMLTDHTARHDDQAWAEWLDAHALRLSAGVDRDAMQLSVTALIEELPTAVAALSEALLAPGWNSQRFEILRQDAVAAEKKAKEDPGHRAALKTASLLYGKHPYGHLPEGDADSLGRIGMDDLKDLYRKQVKPQGAVLAVSGDVSMKELIPTLRHAFSGWEGRPQKQVYDLPEIAPVAGRTEHLAMSTTQTLVQFVRLGPDRRNADFFSTYLLNHILGGGGFASRLMEEVREKRGLVYGVYSYFEPLAASGPFVITLQTRADQAAQAERLVRSILSDMAAGHVTKAQLRAAKDQLIGGFARRLDSNRERVALVGMVGFYNLPLDYLQLWTRHIESVTLEQIKRQAARYLDPALWNVIRVGPARDMHKGEKG